jgi:uncharacterized integral membrane protein (TIGR00697 family)
MYFPIACVLGDVITEVYGFNSARRVTWFAVISSVIAASLYQLVLMLPVVNSAFEQLAYNQVLGSVPRTLIGGWLALWAGMHLNNYLMAVLKTLTEGKFLWLRAVISTVVGEFANTAIFYLVALSGKLPGETLVEAILFGSLLKILVEVVMLPVTYRVIGVLKSCEALELGGDTVRIL